MKTAIIASAILVSNLAAGVLFAQPQANPALPSLAVVPSRTTPDRNFAGLAAAHTTYTDDFAKKPGFGSGRMIFLPGQDYVTVAGRTYRFNTPDLIGLENEPVVYQRAGAIENFSVAVMSKKELRSLLKRRAVTAVESNAIVELRAGKDLVAYPEQVEAYGLNGHEVSHTAGIRAVGSLRAQPNCAHCHGVKEGALLGAFSYTLVPTNIVASAQPASSRPAKNKTPPPTTLPVPTQTNLSFTLMSSSATMPGR